jgi:hypothetical protein
MTRREARRLALLIAWDDLCRSLDTSDEWVRHPETDEEFTVAEVKMVKEEGRKITEVLSRKADALSDPP